MYQTQNQHQTDKQGGYDTVRQTPAVDRLANTPLMQRREKERAGLIVQRQPNQTGLPDTLKTGMEDLSGISLDHVRVHRNSDKPVKVQAYAYAQGNEIYLASGQEHHLPHELGHVVQQMQGRVQTNTSVGGMAVNDNAGLESEATAMGAMALQRTSVSSIDDSRLELGVCEIKSGTKQLQKAIGIYVAKEAGNVHVGDNENDILDTYRKGEDLAVRSNLTKTSNFRGFVEGGKTRDKTGWIMDMKLGEPDRPERLWTNIPCHFETASGDPNVHNSIYDVSTHDLIRFAPLNLEPNRPNDQVDMMFKHRHVAYAESEVAQEIKENELYRIGTVTFDEEFLFARTETKGIILPITLTKSIGLHPIDFHYSSSSKRLSNRHKGKVVCS